MLRYPYHGINPNKEGIFVGFHPDHYYEHFYLTIHKSKQKSFQNNTDTRTQTEKERHLKESKALQRKLYVESNIKDTLGAQREILVSERMY